MSLQDGIFAEEVENDITLFSKDARRKRVLVFPPVNNYRRFIIHQLVQDNFADLLKTFSIGQGIARRTVVCYQSDIISHPKLNGVPSRTCVELTHSLQPDTACGAMGVEEIRRSSEDSTSPEHSRMRHVKTSPAVEIYRPPAARRVNKDGQTSSIAPISNESSCSSAKANRQRRPDRAVYVPKHRRSTEADEHSNSVVASQVSDEIISPSCRTRCNRTRIATTGSPSHENDTFRKQFSPQDHDRNNDVFSSETCCTDDKSNNSSIRSSSVESSCNNKNDERSDSCEYIESVLNFPRKCESSLTKDYTSSRQNSDELFYQKKKNQLDTEETSFDLSLSSSTTITCNFTNNYEFEKTDESLDETRRNDDNDVIREFTSSDCTIMKNMEKLESIVDRDEQTNDKILRRPHARKVSNVLVISETKEREKTEKIISIDEENSTVTSVCSPEKKPKKVARVKSKPALPPSPPIKLNRDECDWDSLFDDNGDCLDPTLIEELTAAVGEVTIEQPKNDYKAFSRPIEVSSDEFAHVIEIYNFPSDFKTSDLATVFGPWKNGGFELKWVDDTHCLGVFSSPLVAAEVLGSDHPFVKTRPLSAATSLSKTKARKSMEFLQPYKSRPQTCAALARRLVTGALGVKLATARQEREQEKLLLREAKEKRRLANKQREDVWEGIITEK